jgi:hypothetical protein
MEWLALVFLCGIAAVVIALFRLVYRLGDRGARRAWMAMRDSSRSLFGPAGPPEELCRRLVQKHSSLAPGPQGGLSFTGSGCRGRLDFISDRTEVRVELDHRIRESLEVATPTFITQLAEDDPDSFRIRGSQSLYRQVFADPSLPGMLREWRVPFEWLIGPSGFVLQLRALPHDEEELWRWLKGAFRLLQAIPGFEEKETVNIPSVSRYAAAEGECQICGVSLGQGTIVRCGRCATPHHEDCWEYTGECSTFACKERRAVR